MFKIFLEILAILFLFIGIGALIYIVYTRLINKTLKGERKKRIGKPLEFKLLILAVVGLGTIAGYVLTVYGIEKYKFGNFEVEISTHIMELDFEQFYDDLYKASRAKGDILVGDDRVINIVIDKHGEIEKLSLMVLIPKYGKLYEYAGVLKGNKVIFRTVPMVVSPFDSQFKLKNQIDRLSKLDFSFVTVLSRDLGVEVGLWIQIHLSFMDSDKPVTHDDLLDSYAIDTENNIVPIEEITFLPLSYNANLWIGNVQTYDNNEWGAIHISTYYLVD